MGNFSYGQITSWGLLRKIKAEEIIDENISSIRLPNQDEFNKIVPFDCFQDLTFFKGTYPL